MVRARSEGGSAVVHQGADGGRRRHVCGRALRDDTETHGGKRRQRHGADRCADERVSGSFPAQFLRGTVRWGGRTDGRRTKSNGPWLPAGHDLLRECGAMFLAGRKVSLEPDGARVHLQHLHRRGECHRHRQRGRASLGPLLRDFSALLHVPAGKPEFPPTVAGDRHLQGRRALFRTPLHQTAQGRVRRVLGTRKGRMAAPGPVSLRP